MGAYLFGWVVCISVCECVYKGADIIRDIEWAIFDEEGWMGWVAEWAVCIGRLAVGVGG